MLSTLHTAISGLRASMDLVRASAHNRANSLTDGFKKEVVHLSEGATGGVVVDIEKSSEPGPIHYSPEGTPIEGSNVDLADETVNLILAENLFAANIAAIKTANEIEGTLLDLLA